MSRIVFDFETTNHSYGSALDQRNRILMVAWQVDAGPIRHFVGDIMDAKQFWAHLHNADVACAFNAKFEQHWLRRCGFEVDSKSWHDPMLAEKVLLGNRRDPVNLGDTAKRYSLDAKDAMIDSLMQAGVCPSEMPQRRLLARCRRDVRTTSLLMGRQLKALRKQGQLHIYRNRCEFMSELSSIEAEGMDLDRDVVMKHYAHYAVEAANLETKLAFITGGINMRSTDQVAVYLYGTLRFPEKKRANGKVIRGKPSKKFPGGKPKTDKNTLTWLAGQATTNEQREFIDLRAKFSKATAALSKNLEFFKGVCDEYDGHFHAQFNQTVAATHRLTSSGLPLRFEQFDKDKSVQFQNMPREFKGCFIAPKGYLVAEVDAKQLEFRVAAYLGQDKQALKDIADPGFDAHIMSASKIYNKDYDELLSAYRDGCPKAKALRQKSKPHTFKPLYGGTKGTEGEERYYKFFAKRYSGIAATQENWLAEVLANHGELVTPWGMRFYWEFKLNRYGTAISTTTFKPIGPMVYNYPVQNLATAEIVPIAICALKRRIRDKGLAVKFVNTVHDSVICYVLDQPNTKAVFQRCVELAFTTDVYEHLATHYGIDFNVPLGVETVIGTHWGEGETTDYDDVNN